MCTPKVTAPLPRPCTDSASSISVVCESSMEKACTFASGKVSLIAAAAEVMRRFEQAEQGRGLLLDTGTGLEIITRQVGETELVVGREFPGQVEVDLLRERLARGDQFGGQGLVELQQHVGCLDFDA